jgi:hypothetical protein
MTLAQTQGRPAAVDRISYDDLYERWEAGNWSATAIDLERDRHDWWNELDDERRRAALWNYSLFLHGEHNVTGELTPFVDAAPTPEQQYFLTTQQADEARHTIFFARWLREVAEVPAGAANGLDATREHLTPGFKRVFGRLEQATEALRRDPSRPNLAVGVTIYHLVIEASLAHSGQVLIGNYLKDLGLMPGMLEGIEHVARDEQRHIGFGVKLLADLVREDPRCRDAVIDVLRELVSWAPALFVPPDWDESYVESFGYTMADMFEEGTGSLDARLRAAGLPPEELCGAVPIPHDVPVRERAERLLRLYRGHLLGPRLGPPTRDPAVLEEFFDTIRLALDPRHLPDRPVTIQWDFSDLDTWHVVAGDGGGVGRGRVRRPDLRFACRFDDWVEVAAGRTSSRRAMARGRLRPRGRIGLLLRAERIFGR